MEADKAHRCCSEKGIVAIYPLKQFQYITACMHKRIHFINDIQQRVYPIFTFIPALEEQQVPFFSKGAEHVYDTAICHSPIVCSRVLREAVKPYERLL